MTLRNAPLARASWSLPLAAAFALAGGCGDDGGDGGTGGPMTTPFLYQCGPINCPLDTACVYDPGVQGREEFYCVEDIGCGDEELIACVAECNPDPMLPPDRECEAACVEAFRNTALHYGCPPPPGNCARVAFPIESSPVATDAGVPLDPRDAGPDAEGSPAGRYVATFATCRSSL